MVGGWSRWYHHEGVRGAIVPSATDADSGKGRLGLCHVLAGALSKFKVIWHFKSLDHTLMERSLFCTVVHLYSWCNG